jgi:hypothetical protein
VLHSLCDNSPARRGRRAWGLYPVGLDGVGDILKFLGAEIVITDRQPAIDLLIYLARNANPARKGDSFEARRDVHPVAKNVAVFNNDVTDIDADPKLDATLRQHVYIAGGHSPLHRYGALHRVHHAGELDEHAVAGCFYDPAVVLDDRGVNQRVPVRLQLRQRTLFINSHESAIASYIGGQYGRQPPLRPHFG